MTIDHETQAQKVVQAFIDTLDPRTRSQITIAQQDDLQLMIREALSDAVNDALGRIEELLRQLRSESSKTELGL